MENNFFREYYRALSIYLDAAMHTLESWLNIEWTAMFDEIRVGIERVHLSHGVKEWSGQHIHSLHICKRDS